VTGDGTRHDTRRLFLLPPSGAQFQTQEQRQFVMTTRTSGSRMVIRDSELAPLCFIATGKTHRVTTDTGVTYTFPETEPGKVYAFNIEAFVNSLAEKPERLSIPLFMGYSMTVDFVEAARVPNRFVIEFTNSYGVPERMEVTGSCGYEPEIANESFNVYDVTVDDYVERSERQKLREIIAAESGYKTRDEFLFMRDLLQSDRHYLADAAGLRRQVRVTAGKFSHAVFPFEPGSVRLSIRSVDGSTQFTPDRSADDSIGEKLFMATLNVQAGRLLISLPFSDNVNVTVDWGDGTEESLTGDFPQHSYGAPGEYTVVVLGHADRMRTDPGSLNQNIHQVNWINNLTAIERWGELGFLSLQSACRGCVNLSQVERRAKFDNVTSVSAMFESCSSLKDTFTQIHAPLLSEAGQMYRYCSALEEVSEYLFAGCPNLEGADQVFSHCTSIVHVPLSLFANNTKLKSAVRTFGECRRLKNAPTFYYNREVNSFGGLFYACKDLTDVPDFCFYNSGATVMSGIFNTCTSLTGVPEHLFTGAAEVLDFSSVFADSGLISVDKDIFKDSGKVTSFEGAFFYCMSLMSVPEDLFRYNTKVTSFKDAFYYCSNLTTLPEDLFRYNTEALSFERLFGHVSLSSVPAGLFRFNTKVVSFAYLFSYCNLIPPLPPGLFQFNTEVENVSAIFLESGLTSVPESLFANCPALKNVSYAFMKAPITSVPNLLFDGNKEITVFNSCFFSCLLLTGFTPSGSDGMKLWQRAGQPGYPASINGAQCFYYCTGLDEYGAIPGGWK
jgi:hypothetical protein